MSDFDAGSIVKKQLVLFFVVDTSRSMFGKKIETVNTEIREALSDPEFRSAGGADANIVTAVLDFITGCQWLTPTPQPLESFPWIDLKAGGRTDMGAAFLELSGKLDRNEFLHNPTGGGSAAPVILLLSDGGPGDNWKSSLKVLQSNKYYNQSIRMACAIGDDAKEDVLAAFTGSMDAVLRVHTPEALRKWIRVVSMTSTQTVTHHQAAADGSPADVQKDAEKAVAKKVESDPALAGQVGAGDEWY